MTLAELRKIEQITEWWGKVYFSNRFLPIKEMLLDTHPMKFADLMPVTPSSAEKKLGMIEGYELCLERLRLAGQYDTAMPQMPPATFAPAWPTVEDLEAQ